MSNQPPFDQNQPGPPDDAAGYPQYGNRPDSSDREFGAAPGGYAAAPGMPGGEQAPRPVVDKPNSIVLAVKLMYAGAALSVLNLILGLITSGSDGTRDAIRDSLRDAGQDVSESAIDSAVMGARIFAVVLGILAVALWLLMAKTNGEGKKWARIVATVLGALSVVSTLVSFTQPATNALTMALNVISLLLAIAILVLLWKPESSRFYEAHSAPRH